MSRVKTFGCLLFFHLFFLFDENSVKLPFRFCALRQNDGVFILQRRFFLVLLFVGLMSLVACRQTAPNVLTENTHTVTDDLGHQIQLPKTIERAISLAPNLTEDIFAVGAGDKLIGVTTYCNFPLEAVEIQKVGDTLQPNIEKILALKPNVIFISTASQLEAFTKQLEANNITVFVTNPTDLDGIYRNLTQLGEIFGTQTKAAEIIASLKKRVADVEAKNANKPLVKTFVQISREPLYTIGKTSFITDLIKRAGGISVTADLPEAYPKLSKETALASAPEAIVLSEGEGNEKPSDVFKDSPAVKNKRIIAIKGDLLSRPSPRIVDGLELLAKGLHE